MIKNAQMRIMAIAALLSLAPCMSHSAEVTLPSRTSIAITPVACPEKALCNVFHVRYVKANGVVEFSRDIPSAWMASSTSIEVRTPKGVVRVWSDR